jgi:hypothetical protein
MVPLDRFTVVLDACTLFPMLVRDVLLTLAGHEFFNPKWSARIRAEWMRNLSERLSDRSFDSDTMVRAQRINSTAAKEWPGANIPVVEHRRPRRPNLKWMTAKPGDHRNIGR